MLPVCVFDYGGPDGVCVLEDTPEDGLEGEYEGLLFTTPC